jgi:single-stranded-DNA-specific exonuclease
MITHTHHQYRNIANPFVPSKEQERLARTFNVHPLLIHLLVLRGISTDEAIECFLNPRLANLPDPQTIKGMKEAVFLVEEALSHNSEIVIWGDYDVDGITATCLLVQFFKKIGKDANWYIPDRFLEGYGLNCEALSKIRSKIKGEFPLLITVDCGISNHREIMAARKLGFKIIVTDHHEPPDSMVDANAVINVKQKGCGFPDTNLAGVGTAFYLAAGVRSSLQEKGYFRNKECIPNLKQFLDYVAIGTIADMVPLTGPNRILVKAGFESLATNSNIGLSALLKSSDIHPGIITSDDISFQIAPKINAAGRLGKVEAATNLLLCSEKERSLRLANRLTEINNRRKRICEDILETTLKIDSNKLITNDNCIILSGDYHSGVVGIVASQLVNIHHLPTIIFAPDPACNEQNILKGSGRSIPGVDVLAILRYCERYLLKYGGHTMAAGMSLLQENFSMFKEQFSACLSEVMSEECKERPLSIDAEVSIEKVFDKSFLNQLSVLEPFGIGNSRPIFSDSNACIYDYRVVGRNNDHLKIYFRGQYANCQGVGFNLGYKHKILQEKTKHTVIYSPTLNRYRANLNWEVRLIDIF